MVPRGCDELCDHATIVLCERQVEKVAVRHETDDALLEPWTYILGVPGKNVRGMLIVFFNKWLAIDAETLEDISIIVRDLHTASLVCVDTFGVCVAVSLGWLPSLALCVLCCTHGI